MSATVHDFSQSERLTRFVNAELGERDRREVEEHLAGCRECADWVETYRLLSQALRPSLDLSGSVPGHPSSDVLSRLALGTDLLEAEERRSCERHLSSCSECSELVALVRSGAVQARTRSRAAGSIWVSSLKWAAGLVLVVGALVIGRSALTVPAHSELTGSTLTGRETVQAQDSILVETTTIESGAELTLRTGNSVAFGDGFSVASGGTLSVVVGNGHGS